MEERRARQIETWVDASGAMLFGLAVGVSSFRIGLSWMPSGLIAAVSGLLCWRLLSRIAPASRQFALPAFALGGVGNTTSDELLLTDADRVGGAELILDEIAAHVGDGSRVVRLFDAAAMPSAGELGARVDRHLCGRSTPDDSQALLEALAELRRSLR